MKKKILSMILALTMVTVLLMGCSSSQEENTGKENETEATQTNNLSVEVTENETGEKEVVFGFYTDPGIDNLDPATYSGSFILNKMVFEGLVEDGGSDGILPRLATSWEISEDGKTYTFHLREGVKFSDGTDFNADAVIFNMNRWIGTDSFEGAEAAKVENVVALDEYTVQITYENKAYTILPELTYLTPNRFISPNAVEVTEDDSFGNVTAPIGTGQWVIESYETDQEFTLVPNPYYWGEKPNVDRIRFKVITDGSARQMAFESGELDIIGGTFVGKIPIESIPELMANDQYTIYEQQSLATYVVLFNQHNEFLQDKNVRLAINHAIDKESMVGNLLNGVGTPAAGLFPTYAPYVTEENSYGYSYDVEKAKQYLAEAGFADSDGDGIVEKDGKMLSMKLTLSEEQFPEWKSICEFVQSELLNIGIQLELVVLDNTGYKQILNRTKDYDMIMAQCSTDSYIPHGVLKEFFIPYTYTYLEGDTQAWYDEELENYINAAIASIDVEERQDNYDKVFGFISENALTLPLCYPSAIFAVNNDKIADFELGANNYDAVNWTVLDVK